MIPFLFFDAFVDFLGAVLLMCCGITEFGRWLGDGDGEERMRRAGYFASLALRFGYIYGLRFEGCSMFVLGVLSYVVLLSLMVLFVTGFV